MCSSKSEARRIIEQNGLSVNKEKCNNPDLIIPGDKEVILQKGKKVFLKVIFK